MGCGDADYPRAPDQEALAQHNKLPQQEARKPSRFRLRPCKRKPVPTDPAGQCTPFHPGTTRHDNVVATMDGRLNCDGADEAVTTKTMTIGDYQRNSLRRLEQPRIARSTSDLLRRTASSLKNRPN